MSAIPIQNDIGLLRPAIRGLAETWLRMVEGLGWHFPGLKLTKIIETLRSPERQEECFRTGASRFKDGFHCYGMAWDFACYDDRGLLITRGDHQYYDKCGLVAEALGLTWGGVWVRQDWDHIQIGGMTLQQVKDGVKSGVVTV